MGLPEGGWPTKYEIIPGLDRAAEVADRVTEVAQRFGRFMLRTPTVHPYMSEHFDPERRGAAEMIDQQLYASDMGSTVVAASLLEQ